MEFTFQGEITMKKPIRIGLVGSGFMGRTHALGFRSVGAVFDLPLEPVLELLADATEDLAATAAARYGFARSSGDWGALVLDPLVDVVDITAPNKLHAPIALAALAVASRSIARSRWRRPPRRRWPWCWRRNAPVS